MLKTKYMMMYKQAEFEDEDSSSIGSVALNSEGISTSATHIRYNSGISLWRARSALERCLFIICAGLLLMVMMLSIVISSKNGWDEAQILHVTSHGESKRWYPLFNRALHYDCRLHHKQHRSLGRSMRRFLRIRVRRLDQEESNTGWEQHVGNVRQVRARKSANCEKCP